MNQVYGTTAAPMPVGAIGVDARARFIVRTYNHLFGAILGFTGIEVLLFMSGLSESIAQAMLSVPWWMIMIAFVGVSWVASRTAHTSLSPGTQYLALVGFVVAEALIFVPLLYIANYYAPGAIESAAMITIIAFAALTGIAFWTRKDFSFLGGLVRWGFMLAIVAILGGAIFGFNLGTWFSVGMVGLAGASILYTTSNIIRRYPEDRFVAAALELFASVALMFWYVLSLFLSRD